MMLLSLTCLPLTIMALDQAPMFEPLQRARLAEQIARVGTQIGRVNSHRPGHIDSSGWSRMYMDLYNREIAWRKVARNARAGAWREPPISKEPHGSAWPDGNLYSSTEPAQRSCQQIHLLRKF